MPVYNGEPFLTQAIESILRQTFGDFDFIIINDGSTDCTAEIIQSYDDPRIRYFEHKQNIGLTRSLNRGLSLAQSPYIARMDADDISLPQRLGQQVDFLDTHAQVGVLGSAVRVINDRGDALHVWRPPTEHRILRWSLCLYTPFAHPTVMMRRNVVEQVGGYNSDMVTAQDYDLWRRLSSVTRLSNLQDILLYLRRHQANVRTSHRELHRRNRAKVSQLMMSEILGENIPIDTVQHIKDQKCETLNDVHQAAQLIYRLYQAGITDSELSIVEQRLMRRYTARRLFGLARLRTRDGRAWNVLRLALRLDPLVIGRAVARQFPRLVRERLAST